MGKVKRECWDGKGKKGMLGQGNEMGMSERVRCEGNVRMGNEMGMSERVRCEACEGWECWEGKV
jgi:hypothetical protein